MCFPAILIGTTMFNVYGHGLHIYICATVSPKLIVLDYEVIDAVFSYYCRLGQNMSCKKLITLIGTTFLI